MANKWQAATNLKNIVCIFATYILQNLTFLGRQAKSLDAAPWLGRKGRTYKNDHRKR